MDRRDARRESHLYLFIVEGFMSKVNATAIQWCDYSVNPIRARNLATGKVGWHCERVSDGCKNCYSATLNRVYGSGTNYAADQTPKVEFFLDEKCLKSMLTFRPKAPFKNGRDRASVFPFDMTDLFGRWVADEWIARLWDIFRERGDVDWLILTKRAERMRTLVPRLALKPLPNVWLGVSAENQERADEQIPDLLETPAAVRFVSAEPLLGPIDFAAIAERHGISRPCCTAEYCSFCGGTGLAQAIGLNWVIVGGESGPGARPCDVSWIRSIKDQCQIAGVPVFVKQLGRWPAVSGEEANTKHPTFKALEFGLKDKKGGDPSEWPADLRVREMPVVRG